MAKSKTTATFEDDFTDEEKEWVEKVERTATFEDVIEVTDALYKYCKENESETDNSHGDFGEMSDENYEDFDFDESGEDDPDFDFPFDNDNDEDGEEDPDTPGMKASNGSPEDGEDGEDGEDEIQLVDRESVEQLARDYASTKPIGF